MINHGAFSEAKGMAPHAKAVDYDWNDDLAEATAAARDGMLISNHSYAMSARDLDINTFITDTNTRI
ncbi:hypothetical protein QQ020_23235 [Fulvivirgaceae bacterium BMA12]|uniref:Uncharacterized protein n=1 Tax=Agaribacillus aureus TaxID=3051825 RepID=A0ABT8LB59_9BACT|nr:hypothetical protein [Fulvivirgaceae bacterium BMA12]